MNCLIDSVITLLARQGQKPEAIRRYIKMKYRINMDKAALKTRLANMKPLERNVPKVSINN